MRRPVVARRARRADGPCRPTTAAAPVRLAPPVPALPPPAGGSGGAPVGGVAARSRSRRGARSSPRTGARRSRPAQRARGREAGDLRGQPDHAQALPLRRRAPQLPFERLRLLGLRQLRASRWRSARQPAATRRAFMRWGERGRGKWITVYTNPGHAYVVIAGLRFDTSGPGESGPRWRAAARSSRGYKLRHPEGF